jgi:hypothetical protein
MSEESKNLGLALGFLTREQAAAQLFDKRQDAALLLQRLIARGALPTVDLGGNTLIRLEDLKTFINDFTAAPGSTLAGVPAANAAAKPTRKATLLALGLPAETLFPMCTIEGTRFARHPLAWQVEEWKLALWNEVNKQLPERVPEPDGTEVKGQTVGVSMRLQAKVTPEIAALIAQGLPESSPLSPLVDYSMFKSMGELFSALRLQGFALDVAAQRARVNMGKYTRVGNQGRALEGVEGLYQSSADYVEIVNTALDQLATIPAVASGKSYPTLPGDKRGTILQVEIWFTGEQLMTAGGIDGTRLSCLAF